MPQYCYSCVLLQVFHYNLSHFFRSNRLSILVDGTLSNNYDIQPLSCWTLLFHPAKEYGQERRTKIKTAINNSTTLLIPKSDYSNSLSHNNNKLAHFFPLFLRNGKWITKITKQDILNGRPVLLIQTVSLFKKLYNSSCYPLCQDFVIKWMVPDIFTGKTSCVKRKLLEVPPGSNVYKQKPKKPTGYLNLSTSHEIIFVILCQISCICV